MSVRLNLILQLAGKMWALLEETKRVSYLVKECCHTRIPFVVNLKGWSIVCKTRPQKTAFDPFKQL